MIYDLRKPMLTIINELLNSGYMLEYDDMITYEDGKYIGSIGDENIEEFADDYVANWTSITTKTVKRYYIGNDYVGNGDTGLNIKKLIKAFKKYDIEYIL
jgi:hypothetical protein